jgi:Zinc knuckle
VPSDVALSGLKSYDDLMTALQQLGYSNVDDVVEDLDRLLDELRVGKRKSLPPEDYLCHVCFQKGHYIKDCPQVHCRFLLHAE